MTTNGNWTEEERFAIRELGHLLLLEGKRDLSRALFEGLVATDPEDAWAHLALAATLRLERQFDRAAAALDAALQVNPNFVEAAIQLGEVNLLRGQFEAARGCAEMADFLSKNGNLGEAAVKRLARLKLVTQRIRTP